MHVHVHMLIVCLSFRSIYCTSTADVSRHCSCFWLFHAWCIASWHFMMALMIHFVVIKPDVPLWIWISVCIILEVKSLDVEIKFYRLHQFLKWNMLFNSSPHEPQSSCYLYLIVIYKTIISLSLYVSCCITLSVCSFLDWNMTVTVYYSLCFCSTRSFPFSLLFSLSLPFCDRAISGVDTTHLCNSASEHLLFHFAGRTHWVVQLVSVCGELMFILCNV